MQFLDSQHRANLLRWAEQLAQAARQCGHPAAATTIHQALEQFQSARFRLAVIGKVKRGKSTLINALLGRTDDELAPVDKLPASSAISCFRWQEQPLAKVHFRDCHAEEITFAQVRDFVTEEANPQNEKQVALVEIAGPFAGLDQQVELVDTPGAGSLHEHHDALVHAFIPQADAVIFLVTARMPLDQDELELLRKLQAADIRKVFFAINRMDECSQPDIEQAIQHNRAVLAKLGISVSTIYRISAKRAFEGDLPGSQLTVLATDLQQFLASQKGALLEQRFHSRIQQALEPVCRSLAISIASADKSASELATELDELRRERRRIEQAQQPTEAEFERSWRRALGDFERELGDRELQLQANIRQKIQQTGLTGVTELAQQLPTQLQRLIETELAGPARQLEERLQFATRKLQQDYPELELSALAIPGLAARQGDLPLKELAGGVATVAVGGSLMVAGQAAAASIAAANATAIAAATTTVSAPSLVSTLGASLLPQAAGLFSFLGTGTATVTAPVALTTTPLWVAMSGPIGWTLIGLGVAAVPFAWRASKLKTKTQLEEAALEQISAVLNRVRSTRVPQLREMGEDILAEFRQRMDGQLQGIEDTLTELHERRPDETELGRLKGNQEQLNELLANLPTREA
jgi:predicted GTPase